MFKVDIWFGSLQFPASWIRAAHAHGQNLGSLSHLDVFWSVANISGLSWRNTQLLQGDLDSFWVRLPIPDLFVADDYLDRKSTRLNSSHGYISYAVFCLKKKKKK